MRKGWLKKEGGSIKTWKRRWFILDGHNLSYQKKENDSEPIDTLDLRNSSRIETVHVRKKKHENCFEIAMPGRVYSFSGATQSEAEEWVAALKIAAKGARKGGGGAGAGGGDNDKVSVNDFDLLNLIGKGSFGKVMQVRFKRTGEIFAMKVLDKAHILEHNEVEHTLAEKHILQRLNHPFLVNLNYSFQTPDKLYFILDYINGGELFFHLQKEKKFSEKRVVLYAAEIVLALEHLHEKGIIYRDLKPENILLARNGHIILTDFGLCKEGLDRPEDRTGTFCGTPEYLAPEVLKGKGYGKAVDWWSFGSLVYEMLSGLPPFYSQDVQEMYRKIMTEQLKFPACMTETACSFLGQLLQREPANRLSDPSKIKKHPFFETINWEDLYLLKITPEFIPPVDSDSDVSQIDPSFVKEAPGISPRPEADINKEEQDNFLNFTYVNESSMQ